MNIDGERLKLDRIDRADIHLLEAIARGVSVLAWERALTPEEAELRAYIEEAEVFDTYDVPILSFGHSQGPLVEAALRKCLEKPYGFGPRGALAMASYSLGSNEEFGIDPMCIEEALPAVGEFASRV